MTVSFVSHFIAIWIPKIRYFLEMWLIAVKWSQGLCMCTTLLCTHQLAIPQFICSEPVSNPYSTPFLSSRRVTSNLRVREVTQGTREYLVYSYFLEYSNLENNTYNIYNKYHQHQLFQAIFISDLFFHSWDFGSRAGMLSPGANVGSFSSLGF